MGRTWFIQNDNYSQHSEWKQGVFLLPGSRRVVEVYRVATASQPCSSRKVSLHEPWPLLLVSSRRVSLGPLIKSSLESETGCFLLGLQWGKTQKGPPGLYLFRLSAVSERTAFLTHGKALQKAEVKIKHIKGPLEEPTPYYNIKRFLRVFSSAFHSVVPRPATQASPGKLLKMQMLGPHCRPAEQKLKEHGFCKCYW